MAKKKDYPASIIIFGAKGDLTRRKLVPALYNLYLGGFLPAAFNIFCVDYVAVVEEEYKNDLLSGINEFSRNGKADEANWRNFSAKLHYMQGDFLKAETFSNLKAILDKAEKENNQRGSRTFYYAVAPKFIEIISDALYKHVICNKDNLDRIVIEKPFGTDLESARKLNQFLRKRFSEKQLYRIDHYLGKETVQNMMAFRFANSIFEPLWNNKYIDHVQISVSEEVSVGRRGAYYDSSGAIRDMIQNHLLQLLCVTAMDCPGVYEAESIRNAKNKVLKSIKLYSREQVFKNVVRGQYTAGKLNDQDQVAYKSEANVASNSVTETFVAAKLFIDNAKWKNVPFFLRTGKCLPRQASVIIIQFKETPHKIFKNDVHANRLIISIQPEQEISLLIESKVPGLVMKFKNTEMDFTYKESFTEAVPEAYEALLLDVMQGDATLFMRADQVEGAWKVVMPIIDAWKKYPKQGLHTYKAGSWGPTAAKQLLKGYASDWYLLDDNNHAG
ncbi:MAG: glucose-6-phosphate dehydrogenase [Ferruginibacter sp.]